jgi:hypothetical protein
LLNTDLINIIKNPKDPKQHILLQMQVFSNLNQLLINKKKMMKNKVEKIIIFIKILTLYLLFLIKSIPKIWILIAPIIQNLIKFLKTIVLSEKILKKLTKIPFKNFNCKKMLIHLLKDKIINKQIKNKSFKVLIN